MENLITINTLEDAMDYIETLKGEEWHIGVSLEIDGGALISGSDGNGNIACLLAALLVHDSCELRFEKFKH